MVLVQNLLKNPTERKRFFRVNMLMWYYTGTGCNPCISSFVVSIVFRDMPFTVYNMVKHFFFPQQEVFPVQYGTKFDTALQTLIAGLVCKLEQLLPMPNLSQVCLCHTFMTYIPGLSQQGGLLFRDPTCLFSGSKFSCKTCCCRLSECLSGSVIGHN